MDWKTVIRNVLLSFVLVTIGFAIGRETTLRAGHAQPASGGAGQKTIVYYMHGRMRCITCNSIEKQASDVVTREFATELQDGRLEWQRVNYEEREDLARRYNVAGSGVVLAKLKDGQDLRSQVLDDVWTLVDDIPKFDKYVADAIRGFLDPEGKPR